MRTKTLHLSSRIGAAIIASVALLAGMTDTALSQTVIAGTNGNLSRLPNLTELQQPTATAVNQVCAQFVNAGATAKLDGTDVEKLYFSCRLMVHTANDLAKSGPTTFSLKIDNPSLRKGVQALSPVQMNAQKQMSVEASKMSLIGARLLDVRSGTRGFVIGHNGQEAQTSDAAGSQTKGLEGATGGAAAADDPLGGRWGGFFNVGYSGGDVDQTTLQDAYKYHSINLLAGADYRFSDSLVLGGAISYSDTRSDYEQSLGKVKAATTGVAGYGTYYIDPWYVDGFLAYGSIDYDSTRNIFVPSNNTSVQPINTSATARPKGDQWSASIAVGRNYAMGTMTVTPTARLGYISVKNKSFSENEPKNGLALAVESRTLRSLQSALGAKLSTVVSTSAGVFGPYVSAQWLHEFQNDHPSIISKYVSDPFNAVFAIPTANPTRDYAVLLVGTSVTLPNNLSGFAQVSGAVGLKNESNYGIVIGVRKQF